MALDRNMIWSGYDENGIRCCVARSQWMGHVAKRPEIEDALELTIQAMVSPEAVEPDPARPDEPNRRFRLLAVSGTGSWEGYNLRVSVKYVRQETEEWVKFYQSCWYERAQ